MPQWDVFIMPFFHAWGRLVQKYIAPAPDVWLRGKDFENTWGGGWLRLEGVYHFTQSTLGGG